MTIKPLLLTYDTDSQHPGWLRLQRSLVKWGWDYHFCPDSHWAGFGRKLKAVAAACRQAAAAGYSHAISIDARDSICCGPPAEFQPPPQPLTFATERNCWPDSSRADSHPPCPHPWRFTHSPFCLDLRYCDLLQEQGLPDWADDQRHATDLVLSGNPQIGLDTDCRLVQSVAFSCKPCSDPEQWFLIAGNRLQNRLTGSWPLFIHFNGGTDDSWIGPLL